MQLKLFKSSGTEYTEILACYELPGPGLDPVQGLTFRGLFPLVDGQDPNDPATIRELKALPTSVQFQTGCNQSYPSDQYEEIPLWLFRTLAHRIMSGMVMELFEVGQLIQPDTFHQFTGINRPKEAA
jgi:hypothetical protein